MFLSWDSENGSWHMSCVRGETLTAGCKKATTSTVAETVPQKASSSAEGASFDRVLVGPLYVYDEVHPNASPSSDPRLPGLEPQLGAGPDRMPRERPAIETQPMEVVVPQQDTLVAMKRLVNRLKKSSELLQLHLKQYHMSPAQFRHRTSSLRLPEDVHDRYKRRRPRM